MSKEGDDVDESCEPLSHVSHSRNIIVLLL